MTALVTVDPEVAAFIRAQPRELPYSELVAACVARFGLDRSPDAETLRLWWLREGSLEPRGRIDRDPEIAAAIRDLVGRLRPSQILAHLQSRFPADRVPARSVLYRFVARETAAAAVAEWQNSRPAAPGAWDRRTGRWRPRRHPTTPKPPERL